MGVETNIRYTQDGVTYDRVVTENCGNVTLTGRTRKRLSETQPPTLLVDDTGLQPVLSWRMRHDADPAHPLSGFGFQWKLEQVVRPATFAQRLVGRSNLMIVTGSKRSAIEPAPKHVDPDYSHLFSADRVLNRHDIYGSGPPSTKTPTEVEKLFPLMQGRILDFGCGAGALVAALRRLGREAYGIDVPRKEITDRLLNDARPYVSFYAGSSLPYAAGEFDCATAFEVLEHIDDYETAVKELKRVSKRLVLSVPDIAVVPLLARHSVVPWHLLESTHVNFFTQQSLATLLRRYYPNVDIARMSLRSINGTPFYLSLLAIAE